MSTIQSSPFVNFQGRAREAMEFYHKVLGGQLDLRTMNERGVPKPAGPGDRISYARLESDGALIIGSDGHPDYRRCSSLGSLTLAPSHPPAEDADAFRNARPLAGRFLLKYPAD
jgi:uncharacterized glyoxalase superfamily protein PhnB